MNRKCRRMAATAVLLASALCGQLAAGAEPTGFFAFYERNRREQVPNYVTEDFLVRAYLLTLEAAVTEYEEEHAAPALRELLPRLRAKLGSVTEAEQAAQGYLAVLQALLAGREAEAADPPGVAAELARVRAAEGLAESPLLRQRLDYSQFRVRGKYTRNAELSRYFQAVRVAGTVLFPLLESRATGISAEAADALTGAAWLISRALAEDEWATALYERATGPLDYVFGPLDAMTAAQYARHEVPESAGDGWRELRQQLFAEGVRPRVFGSYVDGELLEPGVGVADVLAGWQLLPGRWTPASAAFQELVHDRVGPYVGSGGKAPFTLGAAAGVAVKAFPTVMELGALLGSAAARERLERAGETEYEGYDEAFDRAAAALKAPAGLATDHLELLRVGLTGGAGERRLNTALGFWVQQRHGSVAYAKQSYTVGGRSMPAMDRREEAWLEPAGELYRGLALVARRAGSQLRSSRLEEYAALAERCADLAGKALGADEVRFLNELDQSLSRLAGGPDRPVVIDYHTDANSEQAVHAALGWPREVRREGGRGASFAVYEFKRPTAERLDDESWGQSLEQGDSADPLLAVATKSEPPTEGRGGAGLDRAAREREWRSPLGMEFVWIPAGQFVMGSPEGEEGRYGDEVQHEVRISRGYWLGKYEVTQGEWEAVMGGNSSTFKECGPGCPVETVSWDDVQEFIRRLNKRDSASGYRYRLPTEAEWEYAARAGSAAATPGGDLRILGANNAPVLDGQAWYGGNSGVSYGGGYACSGWEEKQYESERCGTHPVGQKRANGWGLHDMLGNVWEWTADWYGRYPSGSVTDPEGPWSGSDRVVRGGGWADNARNVRSATRGGDSPGYRDNSVGFRLVRTE